MTAVFSWAIVMIVIEAAKQRRKIEPFVLCACE